MLQSVRVVEAAVTEEIVHTRLSFDTPYFQISSTMRSLAFKAASFTLLASPPAKAALFVIQYGSDILPPFSEGT